MLALEQVEDVQAGDDDVATEVEDVLDDVRAFLDDPIALLERALLLLRAQAARGSQLIAVGLTWGLDEWDSRAASGLHSVGDFMAALLT